MIYLPKHFDESDRERTLRLMRDFPFATLVGVQETTPIFNHLPILVRESENSTLTLVGHMAARNPQAAIPDGATLTALFHGPHTYITPTWYQIHDVPTWNYAVVHAAGQIRWIRGFRPLVTILKEMANAFEGSGEGTWRFSLPDDLKNEAELTAAIVGFEIRVDSLQSKFKLSQNRSSEDQAGVRRGLGTRGDEMSRKVLDLMEE